MAPFEWIASLGGGRHKDDGAWARKLRLSDVMAGLPKDFEARAIAALHESGNKVVLLLWRATLFAGSVRDRAIIITTDVITTQSGAIRLDDALRLLGARPVTPSQRGAAR